MKKHIRKISYCSFFLVLFFGLITFADAEKFIIDTSVDCKSASECEPIPNSFDSNGNEVLNDTYPKYVNGGNNTKGARAYCTDHDYYFYGVALGGSTVNANVEYIKDKTFNDATNCTYKVNNTTYKNGDCSEIVGYIINESSKYYTSENGYSSTGTWYWTQVTIWAYFAKFAPSNLGLSNTKANTWYDSYSKIRTVINKAWSAYATATNNGFSDSVSDDVKFTVTASDLNFYYKPSTSSCNSGVYRTKEITLTNNESRAINITLSTNSDVYICRSDANFCSMKMETRISANSNLSFYLKSSVDSTENITLKATASYEADAKKSSEYDSVRWIPTKIGANQLPAQGMITYLDSVGTSGVVQLNHESSINTHFSKVGLQRKTCANLGTLSSKNSSSNPTSKVCADTDGSVESHYTAEFEGCTCFGLDLGEDRYVNIIVTETAAFRFGKLTPSDVLYSGGGFAFADSGITTAYGVKVAWAYADTKNGVPYYYNGKNLSDFNAINVADLINQKLLEQKLKSSVNIEFSTRDSNDYKNTETVKVPLKLDMENLTFSAGTGDFDGYYEFNSGAIEMADAYFSNDGKVKYGESNQTYSIFGGNKYYVPINYNDGVFPFNINVSDLSIVDGIEFWYKADCGKKVEDKYKSLYYRSIDVGNPFPKADNVSSKVPENWRLWYCGSGSTCSNASNQARIKNTYQDYPNKPIYKTILDSKKVNQISAINDYYTSWSNINLDGTSEFVTNSNLFEFDNSNSYCKIGEFSSDCDK